MPGFALLAVLKRSLTYTLAGMQVRLRFLVAVPSSGVAAVSCLFRPHRLVSAQMLDCSASVANGILHGYYRLARGRFMAEYFYSRWPMYS